ncbi:MAG TPA: hypothetical protein VK206_09440 [Anaerolineales bacterium]|nr:hypothetical protein [Anaerolineales bacterium]HLO30690.1 hypothetical protein [Anaerolineales bacterium]
MKNLILFSLLLMVACSPPGTAEPSEFPLAKGTTWVYTYQAYEPAPSDPTQTIEATYQLTERIIETETASPYFVAHVKKDYQLIKADPGWTDDIASNQPGESWYIVKDHKLFESRAPFDVNNIDTDAFLLAYEFPLTLSKSWCWPQLDLKDPNHKEITSCEFAGKRMVTNQGHYQTPAGTFDHCYELTDYSNGGNVIHWFCQGVGIVFMKFDHAGTRFGFEQTLMSYRKEKP